MKTSIGPGGDGGIVGHEDQSSPGFYRMFFQKSQDPLPVFGVQIPGGLIRENDDGIVDPKNVS
jgi:hypothetical protein